jgi:hypothetical protein
MTRLARRCFVALLVAIGITGCSSTGPPGEYTAPDGVKQGAWDEYCRYAVELTRSISRHAVGTLEDEVFGVALRQYRDGLVRDAGEMPSLGSKVEEIIYSIDRLHLQVVHELGHEHSNEEAPLNYSEVRAAVDALPACRPMG